MVEKNIIIRYTGKDKKSGRSLRESLVGITKLKYFKTRTVSYIFPGILYDIPFARIDKGTLYVDKSIFELNDKEAISEYLSIYGEISFEETDEIVENLITGEEYARRSAEQKGYKLLRRKKIPRFKNN